MTGRAQHHEASHKKKLQSFLAEMLKLGTVKGFKYLAMYMRGREEMVISIVNHPQSVSNQVSANHQRDSLVAQQRKMSISESFSSNNLPYDQRSLMLSMRSQMLLSSHGVQDVGLPPASPSDGESLPTDENSTLFMIAGYSRYSCPYVWVRSNHERLVKLTGASREKDCPLKLKSILRWNDSDVYVWDIVAELVKLCTYPAPRNPFAIDFEYFSMLPLPEQVLATAAMTDTLQRILLHTPDQKTYAGQVLEELQLITRQHFTAMEKLIHDQGLPVLQQQSQKQQTTAAPRHRTSSYNQPPPPSHPPTAAQYGYTNTAMF